MSLSNEVNNEFKELVKCAYNGTKRNGSNKVINAIANNGFGGAEAVGRMLGGEGIGNSLIKTFAKDFSEKTLEDGTTKLVANGWDAGKIAGSYLGVAGAGRVLSGGGLYKDGNGNTNLVGVPFV